MMTADEFVKAFEDGARAADKWAASSMDVADAWQKILSSMKGLREKLSEEREE